jgi:hypothetical protein
MRASTELGSRARPRASTELTWCALVLAALSYAWLFSSAGAPNERTRLYLTASLVDEGSLAIDGSLKRFGKVLDLARHDQRTFTDKAPGSSLLAVPAYGALRLFRPAASITSHELVSLGRTWVMLPFALLGFVLLRRLLDGVGVSAAARDLVSVGYALGSPAFHYGTAFYGHVLVSTLLIATLLLLLRAGVLGGAAVSTARRRTLLVAAGACAGLMGLTEYQAIVASLLCALPIVLAPRGARVESLVAYGLGALPFAAALLVYNALCFGGPFELSYHHLAAKRLQDLHGFGLAGATYPTAAALGGLSFSLHRGLVPTAPLLALGVVGLFSERRRMPRGLWTCALGIVLYFVLIVASSSVWFGGWAFGPRLLIPILPLLALAAALLLDRADSLAMRALAGAAAVFGVLYNGLVQLTFGELPLSARRPLADSVRPMLEAGVVSPNLACKLEPLSLANLWPAALLGAALVVTLALRAPEATRARRAARALVSLVAPALVLAILWRQPPTITPPQLASWVGMTRKFVAQETRCAKGPRTDAPRSRPRRR